MIFQGKIESISFAPKSIHLVLNIEEDIHSQYKEAINGLSHSFITEMLIQTEVSFEINIDKNKYLDEQILKHQEKIKELESKKL